MSAQERTILELGPVAVADERQREDMDTTGREFSVTLHDPAGDVSWGHFISEQEAIRLQEWLTAKLELLIR